MMIDKTLLEAKRTEYEQERQSAEYALLRIQGALVALDELLAILAQQEAQEQPAEE